MMMDNSSRNIVKFIGAITFAALLIMGARFYAESRKEPMPVVAKEVSGSKAMSPDTPPDVIVEENGADLENPDEELLEEDAELIMGEPSMDLETGAGASYNPPALAEPLTEQQSALE